MPENKINSDQVLTRFLDEVIAAKGGEMSQGDRLKLRQNLQVQLDAKIDEAVLKALPKDKLLELSQKVDGKASEEEIDDFFKSAGVNFEKVALETMVKFREEYLGSGEDTGTGKLSTVTEGTTNAN